MTPKNQIRMQKKVHVMKQAAVKRKMLEFVKVLENVILGIQKKSNGKSSEEEEIKLPKCGSKGDEKSLNEKTKESISEEEEIGIRKCRIKS